MTTHRNEMTETSRALPHIGAGRRLRPAFVAALLALLAAMAMTPAADASPTIDEFLVTSTDQQAGGHPDLSATIRLDEPGEPEVAGDLIADLPEGVFGNPGAITRCRSAEFVLNGCAAGAQVGTIELIANHEGDPGFVLGTAPVYNMQAAVADETARLAFVAPVVDIPVVIPINVRTDSDYGLRMRVTGISQQAPLGYAKFTIWGFPADPEHDEQRFYPGTPAEPPACVGELGTECLSAPFAEAAQVVRPYLNNPSVCTGAELPVTLEVRSYQDPGSPAFAASTYPETIGCEKQKFDPVFRLGLTTDETDSPSGLDIELQADQFLAGTAPAQSQLRAATLTLPDGLTINPDAADGQSACLDAQARFGSTLPAVCPDNAKIGTLEVVTPALEEPLTGSLYFGEPKPGDQYRLFMVFSGSGINAKLFASVKPDPFTGRLTVTLLDLPQVPFTEFNLHLFASDRGLMATPTRCTVYRAQADLVPWNGELAPQRSEPVFGLTSGPNRTPCPGLVRPFNPRLAAGTTNSLAGDHSSFLLRLDRDDGDQFLRDINFRMPPGFTGSLRGISYCPEPSIAAAAAGSGRVEQVAPSCPASSQVGTTNVAAGPGGHPFHAVGKMYLAGPFKGAPLSVVAITPALAGPYDYGVVVVRVALHVDPLTAQVSAVSDTVPSIIGGVPIRMRRIQVNIDKPNFTINPTNCSPFTVDSQGIGDQGTVTDFASFFQAVNCATLPFRPRMAVRQIGRGTRRSRNPKLRFDLLTRAGDANVKFVTVVLSNAFQIDQRHLGNICSEKELAEAQCAGRTAIGRATTWTPLLDRSLNGPVYAVSGSGGLPRLAFLLNGQVNLVPRADTDTLKGGRLRTTVPVVPDAPIGHFRLFVFGGKRGYLSNTRNLCQKRPKVRIVFRGQNGARRVQSVRVKTSCAKKKRTRSRSHRSR